VVAKRRRRHKAELLATAPRDRLVVCRPEDGWEPICRALGLTAPAESFPRVNTTEDWQKTGHGVSLPAAVKGPPPAVR
jgi:hypothetical protein